MAQNDTQVVPWYRMKKYLEEKLNQVRSQMDTAVGEEMYRLQGDARTLKKLMNLPEALALVDEEDRRVEDEKRGRTKGRQRNGQAGPIPS